MSLNLKLWHFWFCIHGFGFILPLLSRQQKHVSPAEWLLTPWQPVVAELSHKLWSKCTDMSGRSLWRGWDLNPRVFFYTHLVLIVEVRVYFQITWLGGTNCKLIADVSTPQRSFGFLLKRDCTSFPTWDPRGGAGKMLLIYITYLVTIINPSGGIALPQSIKI